MKLVKFNLALMLLNIAKFAGANRGWGNRYKSSGGYHGGGNWRPSSNNRYPQHQNNVYYVSPSNTWGNNGEQYNHKRPSSNTFDHSGNSFDQDSTSTVPTSNTENPQIDSSSQSDCLIPWVGDLSKFELRCILLDTDKDEDCLQLGKQLASGTVVMLRCKPPYVSETGEGRLWTCDDGVWKGELKGIQCVGESERSDLSGSRPQNPWQHNYEKSKENHRPRPGGFQDIIDSYKERDKNPSVHESTTKPQIWRPYEENQGWHITTTTTTTPIPTTMWTPWTTTSPTTTISTTTTTATTTTPTTTTTTTTKKPDAFDWNSLSNSEVKCPPLTKRPGVSLKCISKMPLPWAPTSFIVTEDECETSQPVGSEATYQCQKYYEANAALKTLYRKCKKDGSWSGGADIFSCALECGVPNPVGQIPLITHGEPTYKAQWPWHAALFYRNSRSSNPEHQIYQYNCGATLITAAVAATAAHCVTEGRSANPKDKNDFRIDLGRYERTVDDEFVQTFFVDEVIVHPDYNPLSYDSDIAILILKTKASINYHVRPICYPQGQNAAFEEVHLASGSFGTVVGFGKNENNVEATVLHMAKLRVVSSKECALSFSDTTFGSGLAKSTTFCAGLQNGTNVCSGDSGGGIYFPTATIQGSSRWYLLGLVSVGVQTQDGTKRCDPKRFSVFTKISPYADWIGRVLSENDVSLYY